MHGKQRAVMFLVTGVLLTLGCARAGAAEPGFYAGAGAGWSIVNAGDSVRLANQSVSFDLDDGDFASKGFAGVQVLPWAGIEGGYVDLGSLHDSTAIASVDAQANGWNAFVVGSLPLTFIDLFAKAGFISYDADVTVRTDSGQVRSSSSGKGPAYGAGVAINVDNVTVRAEAERFGVSELDDPFVLSVGVALRF